MKNITVIDYGMSNLHSVIKSFQKVSNKKYKVCVATANEDLEKASMIVLPGQGAAKSCMQKLAINFPRLHEQILNKPFFGICLGFQILFEKSYEDNGVDCLSVIKGSVNDFSKQISQDLKVPHMGWNRLHPTTTHPLLAGLDDVSHVYFVHSYYVPVNDATIATCNYGQDFTAIAVRDNFLGCQFHPERSGQVGARILQNFMEMPS